MKKLTAILLVVLMCLSSAACGKTLTEADVLGTWQVDCITNSWSKSATEEEKAAARAQLKATYPNATTDEELLKAAAQAVNSVLRTNSVSYTIRKNGECIYQNGGTSATYTWEIKDNLLYVVSNEYTLDVGYATMVFEVKDNQLLSVTDSAGIYSVVTFNKK